MRRLFFTVGAAALVTVGGACIASTPERPVRGQEAPPAPLPETAYAPPAPGMIWIRGSWHYDGNQYVWIPGRWESPPPPPAPL
jgi:hypothetical protein